MARVVARHRIAGSKAERPGVTLVSHGYHSRVSCDVGCKATALRVYGCSYAVRISNSKQQQQNTQKKRTDGCLTGPSEHLACLALDRPNHSSPRPPTSPHHHHPKNRRSRRTGCGSGKELRNAKQTFPRIMSQKCDRTRWSRWWSSWCFALRKTR